MYSCKKHRSAAKKSYVCALRAEIMHYRARPGEPWAPADQKRSGSKATEQKGRSVATVAEKSLPRIVDVEAVAALLDPDRDCHTPHCKDVILPCNPPRKHFHVILRRSVLLSLRHTEDSASLELMGGSI